MFHQILHKIKKIRQQKAVILMYHQVCERGNDPWELAVHPDHFYDQLEYLKKNFNVIPVEELAGGIAENKIPDHAVALTFDDGFKDNYTTAAPLLDWYELPATFYVSTRHLADEQTYWWDALEDVLFHTEVLPVSFEMMINGERVTFDLGANYVLQKKASHQIRAWNYHLPIANERIALYMILWSRLKTLSYEEQCGTVARIREWAGVQAGASGHGAPMSVREIQMLSENPLFSVGAHTVHHSMLAHRNAGEQEFEVRESKRQIEQWLRKPVTGFSYPYGNFNGTTREILRNTGFRYAVSTESKIATREADVFALPRIQVKNWSVYEFALNLNEMVYE